MTTWNYRIVRYRNGYFGLHEVYYYDSGEVSSMTENPVAFCANPDEDKDGIIKSLERALADARRWPILEDMIDDIPSP